MTNIESLWVIIQAIEKAFPVLANVSRWIISFFFFLSCVSWLRLVIKAIDIWPVPIPHLSAGVWNIPVHKSAEVIGPKGGKPCDGSSDPEDLNTLVVFLRFFHFARRFWNHTYRHANKESLLTVRWSKYKRFLKEKMLNLIFFVRL